MIGMPLLSDQDRETVRTHFDGLTRPITILFFTQTIGAPETTLTAKQIIDEVASLSDRITVEEVNFVLERDRVAQYGVEHVPTLVLLGDGEDTRIRFVGAPAGYEFMSLVEAVVLAGTGDSELSPASRALIAAHVEAPLEVLVFVTPTCPHCPRAVTLAHRMAIESPHIRASCVEATEFPDLTRKHRVTGVPKTVVNDDVEILGALPEDAFVRQVVGAHDDAPPAAPETP
jgi:glutaredoxin-like protein